MENKSIFKIWVLNQSLGFTLGWIFHGIFSHLITGEHGRSLSLPQHIMHNVSLTGMAFILLYFQHRAVKTLFNFSLMTYWPYYLVLPTAFFWTGYYLLDMPMDIVFSFLTIGVLNGVFMPKQVALKRWLLFSILSSIAGLVIGTLIVIPLEPLLLPAFTGLTQHIVVFTLEGAAIGIPMAITGGWLLRKASAA